MEYSTVRLPQKNVDLNTDEEFLTGCDCEDDCQNKVGVKTIEHNNKTIWVIGGPNIIDQTIESVEEFYLSRIPGEYDCDGFLSLDNIEALFEKTWFEKHENVEFQIWKKIK